MPELNSVLSFKLSSKIVSTSAQTPGFENFHLNCWVYCGLTNVFALFFFFPSTLIIGNKASMIVSAAGATT